MFLYGIWHAEFENYIMFCIALTVPMKTNIYTICDPLCEIQAKVSKSCNEITSIKVWFQPLISIFDMTLLSQY